MISILNDKTLTSVKLQIKGKYPGLRFGLKEEHLDYLLEDFGAYIKEEVFSGTRANESVVLSDSDKYWIRSDYDLSDIEVKVFTLWVSIGSMERFNMLQKHLDRPIVLEHDCLYIQ